MLSRFRFFVAMLAIGLFLSLPGRISGQQPVPSQSLNLPEAPQAQPPINAHAAASQQTDPIDPQEVASLLLEAAPPPAVIDYSSSLEQQSTPAPAPQQSSSSQEPAAQPAPAKTDREKAADQLKEQEHQRVAGVMATFNTTRNRDALPLSPGQKFQLFFKSSTDPWPFLLAGVVAGIGQADDSPTEWGQGLQGYAKRFGGNYTDAFIGNFFGNAVLPVVLKEDPRYFQMGTGNPVKRVLWAASSTFWCRRDNGKWGPNYANVGGNMIGSAIARAYYPVSERDAYDTIMDGFTVSIEGIVGAEVIEFWPDLARHMKRKHDEKMARKAAQNAAQPAQPAPKPEDKK
jgi:hypothetical protein